MNIAEALRAELHNEAEKTHRYLSCLDEKHFSWKPHDKSRTLLELATHIAEIPEWVVYTLNFKELDFEKFEFESVEIETKAQLLEIFEEKINHAMKSLVNSKEEVFYTNWLLKNGSHIIFDMARVVVIRDMVFNHLVHHRGQLSVYMRLLNIKIPGIYGPSADEIIEI